MNRLLLAVPLLLLGACLIADDPTYDEIALEKYEDANRRFGEGLYAECIEDYEYVVKWRDRILDAYRKLAICYERTGKPDLAIETLRRLLRVEPTDANAKSEIARLERKP